MGEFDNPVKCELIASVDDKIQTRYTLTDINGNTLPDNEQIDIGQKKWPYHWPKERKTLYWNLTNYTEDISKEYWQRRVWGTIFRTFGWLTPRKYQYSDLMPDFKIAHIMDPTKFSSSNVLAHAWLYFPNSQRNGIIEFNDSIFFFTPLGISLPAYLVDPVHFKEGDIWPDGRLKMLRTQPQVQIGMHEVYHGHGYRHDLVDADSLMAPIVKPGYGSDGKVIAKNFIWHERDISRLQEDEGKRFLPIRWLNYFRMRRVRESEYYR